MVGLEMCCVVKLSNKLMMNKKYFEVIKAPGHLRKASSIYNNKTVSIADMKANNVYYYENETSVKKIIARFYSDIKEVLRLIEKNYLNKRHKLYNEKNCFLLEILIRNCNEFINFVQLLPREHRVTFNRICPTNKRNMKVFVCEFCRNIFKNGQSLGGHISQKHPKQSMKYKTKLEIRKQRTEQRNMIILCRKRILYQYGYNYEVLMQKKNMHLIRSVINSHREEYKKLIYEMKRKQSRVLIAECCTHAPLQEDIGRVKIPRMLKKRFGEGISKVGETLDLGVEYGIVQKSGSWFSYGGSKLAQGRDATKALLRDNPELCEELEAQNDKHPESWYNRANQSCTDSCSTKGGYRNVRSNR